MKINPITYNYPAFKSRIKKVYNGSISEDIEDKVDKFEENNHEGAKKLGTGLFASVYRLDGTNYVIKESLQNDYAKNQNHNFFPEATALSLIPDDFDNAQKLVARVETEKGNFYLISTFVDGKAVKYPKKKWDRESFSGLAEMAYNLDVSGIYHNDLNEGNYLIDKNNKARAIDFQFGKKFKVNDNLRNSKEFKTPPFMMPANLQMFEMASLPWYMDTMQKTASKEEVRKTFKEYLETKLKYCEKRADYLDKIEGSEEKAKYERLQARFYRNPSDEIVDLEAKKLQLLYSFRKAFSLVDSNCGQDKNIYCAPNAYLSAIKCAKSMTNEAKCISKNTDDKLLKKFMDYEIAYGEYWQNTLLEELAPNKKCGVWDWIIRNAQLNPSHAYSIFEDEDTYLISSTDLGVPEGEDLRERLATSMDLDLVKIDDVGSIIAYKNNKSDQYEDSRVDYDNLNNLMSGLKCQIKNAEKENLLNGDKTKEEYLVLKHKLLEYDHEILDAFERKNYEALVPNAIKTVYLGSVAKEKLLEIDDPEYKKLYKGSIDINLRLKIAESSVRYILNLIPTDLDVGNLGGKTNTSNSNIYVPVCDEEECPPEDDVELDMGSGLTDTGYPDACSILDDNALFD